MVEVFREMLGSLRCLVIINARVEGLAWPVSGEDQNKLAGVCGAQ
jgi:hypothetical protein